MSNQNTVERINVSKLMTTSGAKVQFQRRQTSCAPLKAQEQKSLTASASPSIYYISLVEPQHIVLPEEPTK